MNECHILITSERAITVKHLDFAKKKYEIAGFMWYLVQDVKIKSKEGKCLNRYEVMEVSNCVTEVDLKETVSKLSISSGKQTYKNSYRI